MCPLCWGAEGADDTPGESAGRITRWASQAGTGDGPAARSASSTLSEPTDSLYSGGSRWGLRKAPPRPLVHAFLRGCPGLCKLVSVLANAGQARSPPSKVIGELCLPIGRQVWEERSATRPGDKLGDKSRKGGCFGGRDRPSPQPSPWKREGEDGRGEWGDGSTAGGDSSLRSE